jgi:hypothetical protein
MSDQILKEEMLKDSFELFRIKISSVLRKFMSTRLGLGLLGDPIRNCAVYVLELFLQGKGKLTYLPNSYFPLVSDRL